MSLKNLIKEYETKKKDAAPDKSIRGRNRQILLLVNAADEVGLKVNELLKTLWNAVRNEGGTFVIHQPDDIMPARIAGHEMEEGTLTAEENSFMLTLEENGKTLNLPITNLSVGDILRITACVVSELTSINHAFRA